MCVFMYNINEYYVSRKVSNYRGRCQTIAEGVKLSQKVSNYQSIKCAGCVGCVRGGLNP